MNTRALAAKTLAPVLAGKASLGGDFDKALQQLEHREKAFFQELCLGALRQFHQLDCFVAKLLGKPLRNKDKDIHALLILGLYQMRELRVPDHAAISECVNAAKSLNKSWAGKLINGVLRNYQRRARELEAELESQDTFTWSHPQWLIEHIQQVWPANWQNILKANNSQPPLTIRINPRKTDLHTYRQCLQKQQIEFRETASSHHGLRLLSRAIVNDLPGYQHGLFSVQDEGAQIAAHLLSLGPGSRVLDACCAPGGKAAHILEADPHVGELVCLDVDEARMQRVRENFARLGHEAKFLTGDASQCESWWDKKIFDGILLDVPCSASGVIRRHPDIKLLRQPADLAKLATLQAQILRAVWQTLAPGGMLVYATCSIFPQENEGIVKGFLAEREDALHDPISANWGQALEVGRQLLPTVDSHDGFYYARIIKKH